MWLALCTWYRHWHEMRYEINMLCIASLVLTTSSFPEFNFNHKSGNAVSTVWLVGIAALAGKLPKHTHSAKLNQLLHGHSYGSAERNGNSM